MKIETPDECMSSLNTSDRCYCERCGKRNARSRCFKKSYGEKKNRRISKIRKEIDMVFCLTAGLAGWHVSADA
jgi:hypothetical protein